MRRIDEKTIGVDHFVHSEFKMVCEEKNIRMKDALMTALTDFIIKQKRNDRRSQISSRS